MCERGVFEAELSDGLREVFEGDGREAFEQFEVPVGRGGSAIRQVHLHRHVVVDRLQRGAQVHCDHVALAVVEADLQVCLRLRWVEGRFAFLRVEAVLLDLLCRSATADAGVGAFELDVSWWWRWGELFRSLSVQSTSYPLDRHPNRSGT